MVTTRELLASLSLYCDGDWEGVFKMISNKESFDFKEFDAFSKIKSQLITIMDDDYPDIFKKCYRPPFVLYYYGNISLLQKSDILGVIGSRKCSSYSKEVTEKILTDLHKLKDDLTIVSGMAYGIDSIAMRTAIENGDNVIGILGSGIDNPYPTNNLDIYEYCKNSKKGLIISEYPNLIKPLKEHFPVRNRLIASISHSIFLPEASFKSGSMITIKYGLESGSDILVLPHNINGECINNELIKEGAFVVTSAQDIYDSLTSHQNK